MKFEHYLKKLHESDEFKKFKETNPKANLCAGFFVLDFETGKDMHQVDYSLPDKKIASFCLDNGVKYKISEQAIKKGMPKIKPKAKTDLDALKGIVEDEMKNQMVTEKIKKMIVILHDIDGDGKLVWNLQCILSGLEILLVHIDDSDQSVLKFEKRSLMELIRPATNVELIPKGTDKKSGEKVSSNIEKLQNMLSSVKKEAEKLKKQDKAKKKKNN